MIPTNRLIRLVASLVVFGVLAAVWPRFASLGYVVAGLLAGVAGIDIIELLARKKMTVERQLPGRLALGVENEISVTLHNPNERNVIGEFFDGLPLSVTSEHLPWSGAVHGRGSTRVIYTATATERGPVQFTECHIRETSILGLWQRGYRLGETTEVKVYPNYEPVIRYTLLAMSNRTSQMGIVSKNMAGQSREFHQLRDYQDGDVLSQIDWKATSRRRLLISREYREQRDQTLIFLLDCGRRMRAMDLELSQFDHCLNATLLLSYIALRQGDQVGVMGFGGTNRWMPPVKGQHSMNVLLNHLYDYQATPEPSDFAEAVERLMARQRRRALVVLLTNLRTEDSTHLLTPLALLRRRHLVVVANLRERAVVERMKAPVSTLEDALFLAAGHGYIEDRTRFLSGIRDRGILALDETAAALPAALANAYLDIKRRGTL
jgi:uncharacterized protein (DUF58 family)